MDFDRHHLLGLECVFVVGELDVVAIEVSGTVQCEVDGSPTFVDDVDCAIMSGAHTNNAKVDQVLFRVLELDDHWDTLTLDLEVDEIDAIEVELDDLVVLPHLSWREDDWDLEHFHFVLG